MSSPGTVLFSVNIADHQRIRLKNGKIIYEDVSVRQRSNCLYRLITRKQYSQSAILNKMSRLYKQAENDKSLTREFINNYQFLVNKAIEQNKRYKNSFCLFRFLKGKTHININSHQKLIDSAIFSCVKTMTQPSVLLEKKHEVNWEVPTVEFLNSKHVFPGADLMPTEEDDIWLDLEDEFDEPVVTSSNFGNLGIIRPGDLLNLINPNLSLKRIEDNNANVLAEIFKVIKLETIGDFICKELKSRKEFTSYLIKHCDTLTNDILAKMDIIELEEGQK